MPPAVISGLPVLHVVGDSTACSDAPLRGWGSEICAFLNAEKIKVVIRAISGRSTRTFVSEGRWKTLLAELKPGDFVLVQFGHNDVGDYRDPGAKGRPSLPGEGDETAEAIKADLRTREIIHTFGWYLRKFAIEVRDGGGKPILLSPVPYNDWTDGRIIRGDQETFVKWTRNAAAATGVPFVDANEIIAREYERLGAGKVDGLFGDVRTHSNPEGARFNAAAIIGGLKALQSNPLHGYFSKLSVDLPPALTGDAR